MFNDLERTCGEIRWRVGGNVFGTLEKTCSAIWRKRILRFGENVFGDFGENLFGDFWRKCVGDLEKSFDEFWRKCVSDLEKSFGDFGENHSAITLEIWRIAVSAVMAILYWSSL